MKGISTLMTGVALAALPAVSHAQTSAAAPASATAPGDASTLEDIVVTAQKRSENMQRVPIAVTAVTSKGLETLHIQNTADLAAVLPGIHSGTSAGAGLFFLRGVGQTSGAPGIVSPISTYIDGVYVGIARLSLFELNGIDQISLLRGPQGSLFGRNASGGLIQVTTKEPSRQASGIITAGYANYRTFSGSLYATGPLSDTLTGAIALKGRSETKGWIYNITTQHDLQREQQFSGQVKLRWDPSTATDVTANVIYGYSSGLPGTVGGPTPGYTANDGVTRFLGHQIVANRTDGDNSTGTTIASLRINHDLGWASLSNLAHGIWSNPKFLAEQSGTPGKPNPNNAPEQSSDLHSNIYAFGDDIQLSSPTGQDFQWVAGFSYEHELTKSIFTVFLDKVQALQIKSHYTSEAYAGFAQVTKTLFADTRLTGGIRYTSDKLSLSGITSAGGTPASGGIPPSKTYNKVTWRVSLDHSLTPDVLLYASANRGFKSGQYSIVAFTNPPVSPETVTAYEAGFKSELFDHHLRLNLSAFYQDMKNLQLRALQGAAVVLYNAASARSYGVDMDFNAVLSKGFSINGGLEWLPHANYTRFPGASSNLQSPITTVPAGCTGKTSTRIGGTVPFICDLTGNRMIMAPKLSLNLGFSYAVDTSAGQFTFSAADSYSSMVYIDPDHSNAENSYHLVTASVNYVLPGDRWNMRIWSTNLANAKTYFNAQYIYLPGEPRRFGVEVGLKF